MTFISAQAVRYSYKFDGTPISEAILRIAKDHPDLKISFIYKELDNYKTSARIHTDDAYVALRQITGLNPVSVIKKGDNYYVEALQHGKFCYRGRAVDDENEPVMSATVMLLAPRDSTVITYGVTDDAGYFVIPCDQSGVIGKLSCMGYKTVYEKFNKFSVGTIKMPTRTVDLESLTVEGRNAILYSDKSVYLPTSKQKNSAQNAEDLIHRMAIPQLRQGDEIKTVSGQPVEIFIDYIPATTDELAGMRTVDVKRIEYYEYPNDPRFQGKVHVLNFIMQKYQYGGYVKGLYYDNFVTSRQFNGYAKLQYKKMTFDWAAGVFDMHDRKGYENTVETFRLPQEDGYVKEFQRKSEVDYYKNRRKALWTSLKGLYQSEKVVISTMITADIDRTPKQITEGKVTYTPEDYKSSDYTSILSNRINSLIYSGYWYFSLPSGNYMTFDPYYAYSHTTQRSGYYENGMTGILNGASDDSHQANGTLSFIRKFGKAGTVKATCQGQYIQNKTRYMGTSTVSDMARTFRIWPGLNYSYSNEDFYGNLGVGFFWDRTAYGDSKENTAAPWMKLALQYSVNRKNSLSVNFNYMKSTPSSYYRSIAVIQSYPLMSYTGNPSLVPYDSYHIDGSYTLIPNNKFSLSAFGYAWIVGNRYVFDYEATPTGILRTIKQPMGDYAQWQYGVQGSAKLLNNNLQLGVSCYMDHSHNGIPYNIDNADFTWSVSAYYYLNKFYFGASYHSPGGYPDGCMVGTWMSTRDFYTFQAGWSDSHWNLRFFTRNFLRHNAYNNKGVMNSEFYDSVRYIYGASFARFFQISATYTFGFGKKIRAENEAYQASGASSGILK